MPGIDDVRRLFHERFQAAPRIFRAPGRVNLIGEHTDYNDGFVLPAAVNLSTLAAVAPRSDRLLVVHSDNLSGTITLDLDSPAPRHNWSDYIVGVAVELERRGIRLPGANLLVRSDVPMGAGLSSSAAIEVASALALLSLAGNSLDQTELAKICQAAENNYVGARCGIMDQFIACHGRAGYALLLDCRSLQFQLVPTPADLSLVIANTMVRHAIAGGEYNLRRAQCEQAARSFGVRTLRDVSTEEFTRRAGELPEIIRKRARHVIGENARTLAAADALRAADLNALGRLMAESHRSLRDDYEVSAPELDLMVDLAARAPGVIGARMTGGGFGGCTINLVRNHAVPDFCAQVARGYRESAGRAPELYVCAASDAACEI